LTIFFGTVLAIGPIIVRIIALF